VFHLQVLKKEIAKIIAFNHFLQSNNMQLKGISLEEKSW